jgi:hypothetical protein
MKYFSLPAANLLCEGRNEPPFRWMEASGRAAEVIAVVPRIKANITTTDDKNLTALFIHTLLYVKII